MKFLIYNFIKRSIDITASIFGIVILIPVFLIISIIQFSIYGKNIMFNQKRVGINGVIFKVYKFKTMNEKRDSNGELLPDNQRVTKFGKFLRALSLDEIPQLFNILNGKMSIVGPRPQSLDICVFMTPSQFIRHSVKPGLTGFSAIKGRNGIEWSKKIQYDLDYIKIRNTFLDIKIILITAIKVIQQHNVFSEGNLSATSLGAELVQSKKISKEEYNEINKRVKILSNQKIITVKDLVLDD